MEIIATIIMGIFGIIFVVILFSAPFLLIGAIYYGIYRLIKHIIKQSKTAQKVNRVLDSMDPKQAEEFKNNKK